MINICYVVDAPYVGGAEHYVRRVALALDRCVFAPSLVVRAGSDDIADWASEMRTLGIPVRAVPMSLPFRPMHAVGLLRALSAVSPHIVHVNMPGPYDGQMGIACTLARMAGAVAVVTTEHLPMVEFLWKRALVKRFAYRFVDRVLTVCEANVPFLTGRQRVDIRRIEVVPNGVREDFGTIPVQRDAVRARYGLAPETPIVVFVGSIERRKGLDRVIRALARLDAESWQLVVVGTGPDRADCESLAEQLGIGGRTTFTGTLSGDEVEQLLVASDVLTLPSTMEGMPYVILEAMAARTAVVASRVAGIPEVVVHRETGLLIDPADDDALFRSIGELLRDDTLRRNMAESGRKRFEERFTLQHQVDTISAIYMSLVGVRMEGKWVR